MIQLRSYSIARRGHFILGFAALTFVLAVLCGTVLLRSLDSYRATATATQRIQARAAAEGAAVLLAARGEAALAEPLELGDCRVRGGAPVEGRVPLVVDVHPNGSARPTLSLRYRLTFSGEDTTRTIERLELES